MEKVNGFIKVPREVVFSATGSALKIYCYLAGLPSFTKEGAYPSAETISRETGISHNCIDRALHELREKGFLISTRRGKKRFLSAPQKMGQIEPQKMGQIEPQKMGQIEPQKMGQYLD